MTRVAEELSPRPVTRAYFDPNLAVQSGDGQTGLHAAAIGGHLETAGAKIPERHVPVNQKVDEWLERHGSHAEPGWYWYGEKTGW